MAMRLRPETVGIETPLGSIDSRIDDLLAEFSDRWARGESPRAEEFLIRLPESADSQDEALELVYHEFCLAEQSGLSPDPSSFLDRFPTLRARLASMFSLHKVIDSAGLQLKDDSRLSGLPEPGDEVGPYRLMRELGRGGFARVYLARQSDLSDRLVVVKISRRAGVEPQLLARARHPHIVEVLRHAEVEDGSMHLICMPFLGGSTLLDVLKVARTRGWQPSSGQAFLRDLDEVSAPEFPDHAARGLVRESLADLSYPRVATWIVARLADALDHAHRQGVTHGDLKPSNVLIAADGRPMLLDFNLALDGRAEDDGSTCRGGGTLAYMSPERLKALVDSEDQEEAPPLDRHRADLYALGHVLLEMFRGEPPSIPEDIGGGKRRIAARLAETRSNTDLNGLLRRAGVPSGLRPVLKRCLAADPADRYGRGRELAADLDRWWQNRPLLFASEPSWPARAKRWARSRKRPLLVGALMLAMGGIVEVGTSCYLNGSMSERAKTKLELLWSGEEPGVYRFLVQNHWRPDDTLDPRIARRQRALYGLLEPDAAHWRTRSDVTHLPVEDREDLELWLLDRTWTEATARLERSDDAQDLQRALADLEQVPEWAALGPILRLRSQIRHDLDLPEPPNLSADRTTPEWLSAYLKGLAVEFENASEALVEYRHSLKLRPESYWANYRAASACFRLGDYEGAIKHLDRCLHRRPNIGALHAQKSACLYLLNDDAGSLQESNLAVRLDPDQPYAFQNRAFVRARIGQSDGLQADLRRFSSLVGAPRKAAQWEIRLQTMLGLQHTVPIDALELMETMIPVEDMEIRNSLAAMLDEMGHPEEALEQYDRLLQANPDHLIARFRRANLRMKQRDRRAAEDFRAVAEHPQLVELIREEPSALRALHMVVAQHIQKGEGQEALAIANRGLALANRLAKSQSESRYSLIRGESHYALARAYASLAGRVPGAETTALNELRIAGETTSKFVNGWYPNDSVFDSIRPASRTALQSSEKLRKHD